MHTTYLRPGLSDEETTKLVDMAPWICETVVDGEDFWVAGRTEPGISHRSARHGASSGGTSRRPNTCTCGFEAALAAARGADSPS